MELSNAKRLRELEAENAKLKRLLTEAELDKAALKELIEGKWSRPRSVRGVEQLTSRRISQHRACRLSGFSRSAA